MTSTLTIYVLVFLGVTSTIGLALPLFIRPLMDKSEGVDGTLNASLDPRHRFTTPKQLRSQQVFGGILGFALAVNLAILVPALHVLVALVLGCLLAALGVWLPVYWVKRKVKKRQDQFEEQLLDFCMVMGNGLRSGSTVQQVLARMATDSEGAIAEECALVLKEQRLGLDAVECLRRLQKRMFCEDITLIVAAVALSLQTGGRLANVFDQIVETIRERRDFQRKLKALTAQGKFEAIAMSCAPFVVCGLFYLIDPALIRPLFTEPPGWIALGVASTLQLIGYLVIKKIVTIKV